MKKICFVLFIAVALSCSSDDNGPQPPTFDVSKLLRGWAYDEIATDGLLLPYPHNPDCYMDYFGFRNSETQPYQFEEGIFTGQDCSGTYTLLRWEPDGDHINLYFNELVARIVILELTDTFFHGVYEADVDHDGDVDVQEFTGIPYDPFDSF